MSAPTPAFDPRVLHAALARLSDRDTLANISQAVRLLHESGALALPLPAAGATAERFAALAEIAAVDLALARIAEGHTDAFAILAEAGRTPGPGLYGVWAADAGGARVEAKRTTTGWRLHGCKRFASGAMFVDRALVTAFTEAGGALFDVSMAAPGVTPVADTWSAVGMAATESLDVRFDDVIVSTDSHVGGPDFYLQRPGFWFGAVGVAACWYGGALGAYRMLRAQLARSTSGNEHQLAHLGAVAATCDAMHTQLVATAAAIDARTSGRREALVTRQLVEQGCQDVLTRVGRAGGTSALVFDRAHARRAADLVVYLRQHHAERDLAELGRLVLGEST